VDLKLAILIAAIDKASGPLGTVKTAVEKVGTAGTQLMVAGEAMAAAGAGLTAFGARGRAALEGIIGPTLEVEQAMTSLGVVAQQQLGGDITGALERTKAAALDWSRAHLGSADEYIAATQRMISASMGEEDAVKAAAVAMQFATATQSDAAAASKGLLFAYEQMGDQSADVGAEMTRLGDVLTRVGQLYDIENIEAFPESLAKAIPAAEAAGVSFEQLSVAAAALQKSGMAGEQASEGLAKAMGSLGEASGKLKFDLVKTADGGVDMIGSLENLKGKIGDVENMTPATRAALEDAFGPGTDVVIRMLKETGSLQASLDEVSNSAGASAKAAEAFDKAGALKIFQQNVDALKIELGAALLPAIQSLIPVVTDVVTAVAGFAKENPELVKMAATFAVVAVAAATVLGPIFTGVGAMVSLGGAVMTAIPTLLSFGATLFSTVLPALASAAAGAWAFAAALLANPITWIVLAIAAAAILIYVYWDEIVAYFDGVFAEIEAAFNESFIGGVVKVAENLDPFKHLVHAINFLIEEWFGVDLIGEASAWLEGLTFDSFVDGALAVLWNLTPLPAIEAGFVAASDWLSGFSLGEIVDGIVSGATAALAFLNPVTLVVAAFGAVTSWLSGFELGSTGQRIVASLVSGITNDLAALSNYFMAPIDAVVAMLSGYSLADAGSNIINTLVAGIQAVAGAPGAAMADIVANLRAYLPFSPAKIGPLRDLNKIRLVETVAENIVPGPLEAAMQVAMGGVVGPLTDVPLPTFVGNDNGATIAGGRGASSSPAAGGGGGGTPVPMQVNFNIQGGGPDVIQQLEAWIANPSNGPRLAKAVELAQQRQARTAYG
jgi:TP901 family phage tail tape measure protein